ncbi:phospholipase D-like domain-containing protein [Mucilaginibacter sp.]|jgi:phosphatidylserine/phosphatidylglycerophosphate/cardiolipin synthase-like enzyme|uniref:phospholipase D-like domain-containing protein n=1 Tax=Mucilaginibacter sp. TaxID=1882438 RepID=UPI002B649DD9|nr:phospholipase D-like domain-containing protein [Mucilaginibacter sp.]HTI58770.1 phospholipase D-like domain-containing protein [Mucilaginibacter sp.]
MFQRSIIVFPDDTVKPIIDAINSATKSILVKMFLFSDPELIDAVIAARQRGVKVKVMLNPARRNGEDENEETHARLQAAGITVRDTNPSFIITHEKSMVVDGRLAFVKSLNWETKNLTETRDYAIITSHPNEVEEIILCFDADWHRKEFDPGEEARLIWCSLNGRARIAHFIDQAKHTLFIQNERFQDLVIIERIVRAASRGVKVHVMAAPPHTLKKDKLVEGVGGLRIMDDVGIKIHKLKHLKLHGKMLLADGCRAVVGSINLAPGSFDHRRELAIEVHDAEVIERLQKIAHHDWENSHTLDLSDEGLYDDLERRGQGGSEKLVLDKDEKKHHHKKKKHH